MDKHSDTQRVLVTGGAGFIGSHTVDRLLKQGCQVIVLDDFSTGKRENLSQWKDDPRFQMIEANIADGLFVPLSKYTESKGAINRIIHLAAQTAVTYSVENPLDDLRVNYQGTVQVMEYARCRRIEKVVFSSSSAVYGNEVTLPVHESASCAPLSPYGINKLVSERLLHYYSVIHGIPCTMLRFFNVYGPRQDPSSAYSGVISIFADRAIAGQTLPIFGDGEQTRDFVFVDDVSRALATACLSESADRALINIGTGIETSINQLAHTIVDLCGSSSDIRYFAARPGELAHSAAAIVQAKQLLSVRPSVALQDGLRATLNWIQEQ